MIIILLAIMSYLYGSIPFALVIGKLFFNTDVRQSGSGNLGGTNAGRVLGKKVGLIVILLDMSKCALSILITRFFIKYFGINPNAVYLSSLCCVIGHCYPIFAGFRGGKAVSVAIAYAFMTNLYAGLIALVIFLITLKISKYVSLSSIVASASILILSPFLGYSVIGVCTNALIVALIIFKHRTNIIRILNDTESKITWM
jgi:glycerol-3-phosphate acyltransferase PlsY